MHSGSRTVWRICKARYAAIDGEGSRLYGGRWSDPEIPVVYTAGSLSLAALEVLVHLDPDLMPEDLVAIPAEIPAGLERSYVDVGDLPSVWRSYPGPDSLRDIGTRWAMSGESPVLVVPSVVIPEERNYLLNPAHPEISLIVVGDPRPFSFDPRMWT